MLQPEAHIEVVDVHELHADSAAIGLAQLRENLRQREQFAGAQSFAGKEATFVFGREAVEFGVDFRGIIARQIQRVDARQHMAAHAMGADDLIHAILHGRQIFVLRREDHGNLHRASGNGGLDRLAMTRRRFAG